MSATATKLVEVLAVIGVGAIVSLIGVSVAMVFMSRGMDR